MQKFPQDWDLLTRINFLQRKIILNSILYYEYDMNSISDTFYDSICKQLVSLQHIFSRHGNVRMETRYGYVYYDFNGSTGFHLYSRLRGDDRLYLLRITEQYVKTRKEV